MNVQRPTDKEIICAYTIWAKGAIPPKYSTDRMLAEIIRVFEAEERVGTSLLNMRRHKAAERYVEKIGLDPLWIDYLAYCREPNEK